MTSTPSFLVEKAVEKGSLPRYLYKYKNADNRLNDIILNNQLWFSNPDDFNDPFDCQITVGTDNTLAEIEDYIRNNFTIPISQDEVKRISKLVFNKPNEWDKIVKTNIRKIINSSGICCFGGNETNILLWSHYTNSHKGVCLKFDILKDPSFFVTPLPVIYKNSYPIYNHLRDQGKLVDSLVKTKSDLWAYEEEVRVVKLDNGLHEFKKSALVEIIFGCKCPDEEIERIKTLAITNGFINTTFKRAILKPLQYGLDFINI